MLDTPDSLHMQLHLYRNLKNNNKNKNSIFKKSTYVCAQGVSVAETFQYANGHKKSI